MRSKFTARPVSVRLSGSLFDAVSKLAEDESSSIADIIRGALQARIRSDLDDSRADGRADEIKCLITDSTSKILGYFSLLVEQLNEGCDDEGQEEVNHVAN